VELLLEPHFPEGRMIMESIPKVVGEDWQNSSQTFDFFLEEPRTGRCFVVIINNFTLQISFSSPYHHHNRGRTRSEKKLTLFGLGPSPSVVSGVVSTDVSILSVFVWNISETV